MTAVALAAFVLLAPPAIAKDTGVALEVERAFIPHTFVHPDSSATLNYRLLSPPPTDRRGRYPLVVYLHGSGDRGDDNLRQLGDFASLMAASPYASEYPCFVFAPQCPADSNWSQQVAVLLDCINEIVEQYPIDSNRIYLTGFSMGGNGCWHLAAGNPDRFAAVVPVAGRSEASFVPVLTDLPIWIVHGDSDHVVPVDNSRTMVMAINAAGGHAGYTEAKGVKHDSWRDAYGPGGVLPWMFQQSSRARWWKRNWAIILLLTVDACLAVWIAGHLAAR